MMAQGSVEKVASNPDPSWRGLYRAGGVSAALYIIFGIIVPAVLFLISHLDPNFDGVQTLQFISSNRIWWIIEQTLVLGPSIFAIVTFMAIFMALKHINKSYAAIGSAVAIVCQILFLAYFPIVMGLVELSDQYTAAATAAQRVSIVAATECLVAQNKSIGPSEAILALSVLILSIIMLKGVFHKVVAYLGIIAFVAAVAGMALMSTIGIAYLFWWAFFMIWFIAVGIRLYKLGASIPK